MVQSQSQHPGGFLIDDGRRRSWSTKRLNNTHDMRSQRALSSATSSFSQPDASSTAIFRDKLHTGLLERGYERLPGFGATTNVSLSSLQSLDRRRGNLGVFGQVGLGPPEKRPGRFDLTN